MSIKSDIPKQSDSNMVTVGRAIQCELLRQCEGDCEQGMLEAALTMPILDWTKAARVAVEKFLSSEPDRKFSDQEPITVWYQMLAKHAELELTAVEAKLRDELTAEIQAVIAKTYHPELFGYHPVAEAVVDTVIEFFRTRAIVTHRSVINESLR
jgi:hypothetical protein